MASNLVNLGNAFCDQQKHVEAVPVYLRALTIDEKALGHDHPEVAWLGLIKIKIKASVTVSLPNPSLPNPNPHPHPDPNP